jgi:hypothetical protein
MSGHNGRGTANDGAFTGTCSNGGSYNCYTANREISNNNTGMMISIGERGDDRHGICTIVNDSASIANSGLSCIGSNNYGELGTGDCTDQALWDGPIALGGERATSAMNKEASYQMNSVMVITTLGNVYAAGDNTYGKLGRGTSGTACNSTFAKVQLPAGVKAVALANSDEYSAFILGDNGKVYAMGRNNFGQLGDGTTIDRSTPVEVQIPRQETVY